MRIHPECKRRQIQKPERYTAIEMIVDRIAETERKFGGKKFKFMTKEQAVVAITATLHELSRMKIEDVMEILNYGLNKDNHRSQFYENFVDTLSE